MTLKTRRKRNAAQKHEDRKAIATWRSEGLTLDEVHARHGMLGRPYTLSRTQIVMDWQKCVELWQKEAIEKVDERIQRELATMQRVEAEAWRQWHRSKEASVHKRIEKSGGGSDGEKSKQAISTEDQCGDPRYLSIIGDIQDRRIKLLGLDAASKVEVTVRKGVTPEMIAEIERAAALI